ncbi:hypothetical protein PO124_03715 [Bacillus licheniformis]|nr:hypothetical protein [Bacillus licheniformis]
MADAEWGLDSRKGIKPQYKAELPSYAKLPYLDSKKSIRQAAPETK